MFNLNLAILIFAYLIDRGVGEDIPFPDLMCHPGAQEKSFTQDGQERKGVAHYREKANECIGFQKDDPCLRACWTRNWWIPALSEDALRDLFFAEISTDKAYNIRISETVSRSCRPFENSVILESYFTGPEMNLRNMQYNCSVNPYYFLCLEAYFNCSRKVGEAFMPQMYYDFSCYPKYDWKSVQLRIQDLDSIESECRIYFMGDDVCTKACAFARDDYHGFGFQMNMYIKAVKGNDEESKKSAIEEIAGRLGGFKFHFSEDTGETTYESMEVALKVIQHCSDAWSKIIDLKWKDCKKERDQWKPVVECVENVFKCKI